MKDSLGQACKPVTAQKRTTKHPIYMKEAGNSLKKAILDL